MIKPNEFYDLPVCGISDESDGSYFIVQDGGREYKVKMYFFQRSDLEQRQRKVLPCMVREGKNETLYLVQNLAKVIGDYYEENQTYPFIVMGTAPCDGNTGLRYKAQDHLKVPVTVICPPNSEPLRPRQQIDVRVKKVNENKLLFLHDDLPTTQSNATLSTLLQLGNATPAQQRYLERVMLTHPAWGATRKLLRKRSPLWPVKALLAVPYANQWIISPLARERRLKAKHGVELLKLYRCIALHVLEDAEWLKAFSPTESERIRDEIATKWKWQNSKSRRSNSSTTTKRKTPSRG